MEIPSPRHSILIPYIDIERYFTRLFPTTTKLKFGDDDDDGFKVAVGLVWFGLFSLSLTNNFSSQLI